MPHIPSMKIAELEALVGRIDAAGTLYFPMRMLSAETLCLCVTCIPLPIVHGEEPEALSFIHAGLRSLGWQ